VERGSLRLEPIHVIAKRPVSLRLYFQGEHLLSFLVAHLGSALSDEGIGANGDFSY
jgi:hypothetical protein